MSNALAVLIVTVLSSGGPHTAKPIVLRDATISVLSVPHCAVPPGQSCIGRAPKKVATSQTGRLMAHLRPGSYRVTVALLPPAVSPGRACGTKSVRVRAGHTMRLKLYCSIP